MTLAQLVLNREDNAWRHLGAPDYEREICEIVEELVSPPRSQERLEALAMLSTATLRRDGPTLTASRACCAEQLLSLASEATVPELCAHMRVLFLFAWIRLGTTAARGPESIEMTPPLPSGVLLPFGADPNSISDPVKRELALELAEQHWHLADLWSAKQRALDHLNYLAYLVLNRDLGMEPGSRTTLAAVMSLIPGLSDDIRRALEEATR